MGKDKDIFVGGKVDYSGFKNFESYNESEHKKLIEDYPSLYHYTTEEAFASILETKSLWATNCQHFEDKSETKHILPILDSIIKEQKGTEAFYTNATKNVVSQNLERVRKFTYIICFSKDEDSDVMLDYKNNIVINMEFDTLSIDRKLSRSATKLIGISEPIYPTNKILNDIKYKDTDLEYFVRKLNDKFNNERLNNEELSDENMHNLTNIFSLLFQLSVLTKDLKYAKENEIRAAVVLAEHNYKMAERIRNGDNGKISYLDISFEENNKLPIKSIKIKPKQNDIMLKVKIINMLKSYGYDIPVYETKTR
jgi:hypothetical protein